MAYFYLDSSAIVKYYVAEPGSSWTQRIIEARTETGEWAHVLFVSQLALVEVIAAVEKRLRLGEITRHQRDVALARFAMDYKQRFDALGVEEAVLRRAIELVTHHPLRAYDAVQLATALVLAEVLRLSGLSSLTFVSADARLCQAAEGEGLQVMNPNDEGEENDR